MTLERPPRSQGGFLHRGAAGPPPAAAPRNTTDIGGAVATLFWLVVIAAAWVAVARAVGQPLTFPDPLAAILSFDAAKRAELLAQYAATSLRLGVALAGGLAGFLVGALIGGLSRGHRFIGALFDIFGRTPLIVFVPMAILLVGIDEQATYGILGVGGWIAFARAGFQRGAGRGDAREAWQDGVFAVFALLVMLEFLIARNGLGASLMRSIALFDVAIAMSSAALLVTLLAAALLPGALVRRSG